MAGWGSREGRRSSKPPNTFLPVSYYFRDYEPYRLVLLAACAVRRMPRISVISIDAIQKLGADLHALARFTLPEGIFVGASGRVTRGAAYWTDGCSGWRRAGRDFVQKNKAENGTFKRVGEIAAPALLGLGEAASFCASGL